MLIMIDRKPPPVIPNFRDLQCQTATASFATSIIPRIILNDWQQSMLFEVLQIYIGALRGCCGLLIADKNIKIVSSDTPCMVCLPSFTSNMTKNAVFTFILPILNDPISWGNDCHKAFGFAFDDSWLLTLRSPLRSAVQVAQDADMARLLIQARADPNERDAKGVACLAGWEICGFRERRWFFHGWA